MPTQSSSSGTGPTWSRGFSPLFGGPYSDQHLRVSDADRQAVADRLAEHYTDGRLDQAEFDERVGRAMSAKTRADLSGLFDDLPDMTGRPENAAPAAPMLTRRRHRHPGLLIVLAVIGIVAVAHMAVPWLWIGFLAAVVFLVSRVGGRSRAGDRSRAAGDRSRAAGDR